MGKNLQLSGVGGWLALLILGLILFGPLAGLARLIEEIRSTEKAFPNLITNTTWLHYKQLSWLVLAVIVAISISAGYRLWKIHSYKSVRFAIIAIWIVGPIGILAHTVVAVITFGPMAAEDLLPQMAAAVFKSCIIVTAWTLYLIYSVRVKNTYLKW